MARPKFVQIPTRPIERFAPLFGDDFPRIEEAAARARERFEGRAVWHVSSTLRGGGVAEMLSSMLPYTRGAGVDNRWVVLRERAEFFTLTKRLHNNLHGNGGDGGPLAADERSLYEEILAGSARHLAPLLERGDVVFLHDPQTAGLVAAAKDAGARVIWRCHIGADRPDETVRRAWDFLDPYVTAADIYVFSRRQYVWETLDPDRARTMPPSIDPFTPKNQELDEATVAGIVAVIGLGPESSHAPRTFTRADGSPGRVERRAEILQEAPLPSEATTIAQISRWDRLKDHHGVLECFRDHIDGGGPHLVLAGPASAGIADDPESATVWEEIGAAWRELPEEVRGRVHLVSLPMFDVDENGAMVNALQRRADIVLQKSIAEGFGLTVSEAMWKRRPVIGSRVGGIQDQIVDGVSGILLDDPRDLRSLAEAILGLIGDPGAAAEMGERARQRVYDHYLTAPRLVEYAELIEELNQSAAG
jgi:trehalose synthase